MIKLHALLAATLCVITANSYAMDTRTQEQKRQADELSRQAIIAELLNQASSPVVTPADLDLIEEQATNFGLSKIAHNAHKNAGSKRKSAVIAPVLATAMTAGGLPLIRQLNF